MSRELTRSERKAIRKLVTCECANYDSECGCLPLDYPCYMINKRWTGVLCRYFQAGVLPLNPTLEASVNGKGESPDTRLCAVCGRAFFPIGRKVYCSNACKTAGNRQKSRERVRKMRRKPREVRYD